MYATLCCMTHGYFTPAFLRKCYSPTSEKVGVLGCPHRPSPALKTFLADRSGTMGALAHLS
jgi:hypothetical protein